MAQVKAKASKAMLIAVVALILTSGCQATKQTKAPMVEFELKPGKVLVTIDNKPFATYVFEDSKIPRPYFCNVKSPSGIQATRNHPPIEGKDPRDHTTLHPGVWLSFADINGNDYWRLKAKTEHEMFIEYPKGGPGKGTFTVSNYYLNAKDNSRLVHEICRYTILARPDYYMILYDSTFSSDKTDFYFGDQEEFGLGIRVATPITVKYGKGHIRNAEGMLDEKGVWGKQSDWVDYSGYIDNTYVGMMIMPDPSNFRRSWYHARDYGYVAANPFGRKAMHAGPESKVVVKKGEKFHLGFGVAIYSAPKAERVDRDAIYKDYLQQVKK